MADQTSFDKDGITKIGSDLQALMDGEVATFEKLKANWPNAGQFATAQWIERLVDDRRNAVVAHAERLNLTLKELGQRLQTVAREFENADGENAEKIRKAFAEQAETTAGDLATQAENTESEQHNVTEPEDPEDGNGTDGDGYDDVLPGASS